jgi:hypothetical protein
LELELGCGEQLGLGRGMMELGSSVGWLVVELGCGLVMVTSGQMVMVGGMMGLGMVRGMMGLMGMVGGMMGLMGMVTIVVMVGDMMGLMVMVTIVVMGLVDGMMGLMVTIVVMVKRMMGLMGRLLGMGCRLGRCMG